MSKGGGGGKKNAEKTRKVRERCQSLCVNPHVVRTCLSFHLYANVAALERRLSFDILKFPFEKKITKIRPEAQQSRRDCQCHFRLSTARSPVPTAVSKSVLNAINQIVPSNPRVCAVPDLSNPTSVKRYNRSIALVGPNHVAGCHYAAEWSTPCADCPGRTHPGSTLAHRAAGRSSCEP